MSVLTTPRFILSAEKCGSGKSLLAIGLCVALRKRNIGLSCAVIGSDPLQAIRLKRLTRRYAHNIDQNILSPNQALLSLQHAAIGADLLMIEGRAGLFDGISPGSLKYSDAEFAALTRTPVVMVTDVEGYSTSVAALLKGFKEFAQGFSIEGVIANFCSASDASETRDGIYFDTVMQAFRMPNLLGAVPRLKQDLPDFSVKFSQQKGSVSHSLQFYKDIGNIVEQYIDIDLLISLAKKAPALQLPELKKEPNVRKTRIAVSEDSCFNLSYQDNVDLLRYYGAEIVTFSPLADEDLPKRVGGIYVTGGMLYEYADGLAANDNMRNSIRKFVDAGGVVYSEGAGTAYLCDKFEGQEGGSLYSGVGIIKGTAIKESSYFAYNEAITIEDSILGRAGIVFKGASIGEWKLDTRDLIPKALRISNGSVSTFEEGYSPGAQIVSTFSFPHFGSNPMLAQNIVDAAEIVVKV